MARSSKDVVGNNIDAFATIDVAAGGKYPEGLYRYTDIVKSEINGFEKITENESRFFHQEGYLVVHDAFTHKEITAGLEGLIDLIDGKNPEFEGLQYENSMQQRPEELSLVERHTYARKLFFFADYDPRTKAMTEHPKLIGALQKLIGAKELTMFQDMALLKPPLTSREKPWHQDLAYFKVPPSTVVVGVWIALDEATVDNGCMVVIPGSHKEGPVTHFKRRDWQICDTDVKNDGAVAVPLKPGGCLFFHGLMHHGTPANNSNLQRRAMQFHYKATSTPSISEEERLATFGSEGKDASC
jgi:phytanoyl-CoA hydroxylase